MSLSDESISLITGFLRRGVVFVTPARVDLLQPVGVQSRTRHVRAESYRGQNVADD